MVVYVGPSGNSGVDSVQGPPAVPEPPESRNSQPHTCSNLPPSTKTLYYRGLNDYQYYCGGSLLYLWYNGPQNPILIIKAPVLDPSPRPESSES